MAERVYGTHPEPVPSASQLAVLPFLAAVAGLLCVEGEVPGLRLTMHRTMSRDGSGYLQQVCSYVSSHGIEAMSTGGRLFRVDTGIMGAAYRSRKIWRTRRQPSVDALRDMLPLDQRDVREISFVAMPFMGAGDQVVMILYAACQELDFFANDGRIRHLAAMGAGFCRVFDGLQRSPFANLRNFPLRTGDPEVSPPSVYSIQEELDAPAPPRFESVPSFNYESAVA